MLKNRFPRGALLGFICLTFAACSGSSAANTRDASGTGGVGNGGTTGTGGLASGGTTGSGGAHDAAVNDAGHDTSNGSCWALSDCHGGSFCTVPGQSVCGGACPAVTNPCSSDSDCATDAAVPLICVVEPCTCGPTNMGCLAGCAANADCAEGESCGSNHHCAPIACTSGQGCPTDFICGVASTCVRKSCTSDSQCSNACVEGGCYKEPGHCQLGVP
jgi:hypothetical protein